MKQFILTLQRKSAAGKVGRGVGKTIEALQSRKAEPTDRSNRERRLEGPTVLREEVKESDE